jgi:hypothetical protein
VKLDWKLTAPAQTTLLLQLVMAPSELHDRFGNESKDGQEGPAHVIATAGGTPKPQSEYVP